LTQKTVWSDMLGCLLTNVDYLTQELNRVRGWGGAECGLVLKALA